jgi:acyl-CoA thioesterase-1
LNGLFATSAPIVLHSLPVVLRPVLSLRKLTKCRIIQTNFTRKVLPMPTFRLPRLTLIFNMAFLGLLAVALGAHAPAMAQSKPAKTLKIVALGDSLTAGYQLANGEAYPDVLQKALAGRGIQSVVANAGVSGDTTTGGLARLDFSVPEGTDAVLLELGANDMMRGVDPEIPRANLTKMILKLKERNIPVMLFGIPAWSNAGPDYGKKFNAIYPDLALVYQVPLYPFFLEGLIGNRDMMLADGIHPSAAGVREMVRLTLPHVEAFLRKLPAKP